MPRVLIRPFRYGDEPQVRRLTAEAAMDSVFSFFWLLATRELTAQVTLMSAAVLFVVVGFKLQYALCALPATFVLLYAGVYAAHWRRARVQRRLVDDDLPSVFLSSSRCGFWVAEELEAGGGPGPVVYEYADTADAGGRGRLVGTVGVQVKRDPDMREPPGSVAWLRGLAVTRGYRRRGLGGQLLETALAHCRRAGGYRAIELATTECHVAARNMCICKGFEIIQARRQGPAGVSYTVYRMRMACVGGARPADSEGEEAAEA